jgi:hypothetical protein
MIRNVRQSNRACIFCYDFKRTLAAGSHGHSLDLTVSHPDDEIWSRKFENSKL